MTRRVSHRSIIMSIVAKDLKEYGRDKLWAFLTVLVLVVVIVLFWVTPNAVEESVTLGVSGAGDLAEAMEQENEQGIALVSFESEADLRSVVAGEATAWVDAGGVTVVAGGDPVTEGADEVDVSVGLAFPAGFLAGDFSQPVTVYAAGDVPEELENAVAGMVKEIGYALAGDELPVTPAAPDQLYVVLGQDRVGDQVTPRETFRPLLIFLVLLMEMFVMSSIIAKEIQARTVTALLVTPATVSDVLAAKGIAGSVSGILQALVLLVALRSLGSQPMLLVSLMLLGAIMVAGAAMIAGSAGKDFMGTLFYGMLFMIPLMVPAFSVLFPGTASVWIRALPSYPLVEGLVNVTNYGAGWVETLPQIGWLLAWCIGLFAVGWVVLKRRVETI